MSDAAPIEHSTARQLTHLLATEQRRSRLPSVAAGIVRGGALVWADAVGTVDGRADGVAADVDTQYRMGSITKTFVAVAVMQLRDRGRLDLLDRFDDHVPGTVFGDVTIAQLLSHGAGLQAETDGPWWERTAGASWEELAASPVRQRFRAGRRFHYTNVGFAALGELVARAHGADWFEVIRRDLLDAAGDDAHDDAPHRQGRPGTGRASLRRCAAARARARRRRHGTRRPAVDDGGGPRALGRLRGRRHR